MDIAVYQMNAMLRRTSEKLTTKPKICKVMYDMIHRLLFIVATVTKQLMDMENMIWTIPISAKIYIVGCTA
ncbi:hypothetical protein T08_16634 [Trichinella sp. T8]|nr:hypothetical protein T08_16634 [Trichinella sp. T8]